MTDSVELSIGLIVLLIGVAINVYNFFNGRKKDVKTETAEIFGIKEKLIEVKVTMQQVLDATSDIKNEVKQINARMSEAEKEIVSLKGALGAALEDIRLLKEGPRE